MKSFIFRGSDKLSEINPGSYLMVSNIYHREIFLGTDLMNNVLQFGSKPKNGELKYSDANIKFFFFLIKNNNKNI